MKRPAAAALVLLLCATRASAETGHAAWLRYEPIGDAAVRSQYLSIPGVVVALGDSPVVRTARDELARGLRSMIGSEIAVAVGTLDRARETMPAAPAPARLGADGFWLGNVTHEGRRTVVIAGANDRGALYGAFALLRRVALGQPIAPLNVREEPAAPLRWVNEWNNLDGSIERGYGGRSIFFDHDRVVDDLTRARDYARLLASVGVNAASVNNVNANPRVITDDFLPDLSRLAGAFRPWGVALAVAIDFSSPQKIGGLDTFDPLDARVAAFWKDRVDALYRAVPDLAGFVLKADSEGRLGPSAYGRTHADAANVIARALAPRHGVLFYRGFVYDHHMDWQNPKNDRARAAVDNFKALDGQFDDNVILQIKHGPIDFQVREPTSPLFAAVTRTNRAIELQITQEYLGQQRHLCYIVPMWKATLDFDFTAAPAGSRVRELLHGYVGVSNVGDSATWLGHDLAMANLYGFGRLAWRPELPAQAIANEWTRQTFGHDRRVVDTINGLLLDSWPAYESYTGPLGAGTLTDIIGVHYGPGVESSERNGWGQWHRADRAGIGMDRTVATGTGYIGQYPPAVAAIYESLATCPDELLLFMHHVPYTHVLKSKKTVIQHIYDAHYEGAEQAAGFVGRWRALDGLIDRERFAIVLGQFEYQAAHAIVWRDAVDNWFAQTSGIPDAKGRVGNPPGRVEAEAMVLEGYSTRVVTPWETASRGQAVACVGGATCTATQAFRGSRGRYDIAIGFFDESDGASQFRLTVNGRSVDSWKADTDFPHSEPNGHTATRRVVRGVVLAPGDAVRVEGIPDGTEDAVLDYIEITPARQRE